MQYSNLHRRAGLAAEQLIDIVQTQIPRRNFAQIFNEVSSANASLLRGRALEHRNRVRVAAHLRKDQSCFAATRFGIILLHLFWREIRAVGIKSLGEPAQTADSDFFQIRLIDIITNDVTEDLVEYLKLAVLASASDDLARLRHETANDGIESDDR